MYFPTPLVNFLINGDYVLQNIGRHQRFGGYYLLFSCVRNTHMTAGNHCQISLDHLIRVLRIEVHQYS